MDGYYFDDGNAFFKLSDQDILRLRKYYRDSHIAYKRQIKFQKQSLNNSGVRKYSLKHSNPYNYRHTKEKVKAIGKCVIIGGVLVSVVTLYNFLTADKTEKIIDTTVITEADLETSEKKENYILLNSDNMLYVNDLNVQNTLSDNNIIEESNINKERQMIIKKYCDIYCVDYNVVYDKIVELTDNFMSEEYLNKLLASNNYEYRILNGNLDSYKKNQDLIRKRAINGYFNCFIVVIVTLMIGVVLSIVLVNK